MKRRTRGVIRTKKENNVEEEYVLLVVCLDSPKLRSCCDAAVEKKQSGEILQ